MPVRPRGDREEGAILPPSADDALDALAKEVERMQSNMADLLETLQRGRREPRRPTGPRIFTTSTTGQNVVVLDTFSGHEPRLITHREMRNKSADVLRSVAQGETFMVTNNGEPAAVIGPPPPSDVLTTLARIGQLRAARKSPATLRSIQRTTSTTSTAEILADIRGRW